MGTENQEHTGEQIKNILQKHEGVAFTISQLSVSLSVSRISVRKHAKKLGRETRNNSEVESKEGKFRFGKGDTKLTGTGAVLWFGKGKWSDIFNKGEAGKIT